MIARHDCYIQGRYFMAGQPLSEEARAALPAAFLQAHFTSSEPAVPAGRRRAANARTKDPANPAATVAAGAASPNTFVEMASADATAASGQLAAADAAFPQVTRKPKV